MRDFFAGLFIGAVVMFAITSEIVDHVYRGDPSIVNKESHLPESCRPGDRVLMTTAPTAEYYECEAHWIRK